MKKLHHITFGALLLAFAGSAQAILLQDLFNGGSIQVEDKLFTQWELIDFDASVGQLAAGRDFAFVAGNVDVTGIPCAGCLDPGPGLQFEFQNDAGLVEGDGIFAFMNLMFGFNVSVTDPTLAIKDVGLNLTGGNFVSTDPDFNDNGFIVFEDAGTAPFANDLASLQVEFSELDGALTNNLSDSATFGQQGDIWVLKDVFVFSAEFGDSANLLSFTQNFSQEAALVPEPATVLLLGLGLVALGRFRRRVV